MAVVNTTNNRGGQCLEESEGSVKHQQEFDHTVRSVRNWEELSSTTDHFAHENGRKRNVLYVPDAGELLAIARRDAEQHQHSILVLLVVLLLELARNQNSKELMDKMFPSDESAVSMDGFVKKAQQ